MSEKNIELLRKYFENGLTISGGNLDPTDVTFGTFDEHFGKYVDTEEERQSLIWFEKYFEGILEASKTTHVKPMKVVDGQVVIEDGMLFHRCNASLDTLKGISKGLLATEWFGILESELECRFCVSLNTVRTDQECKGSSQPFMASKSNCMLYFDMSNPLMQKLLLTDYYRYVEIKRKHPEAISQFYSPEMVKFIESMILPNSKAGQNYHASEKQNSVTYNWWAIPGGIPAALVNGISISSQTPELMAHVEEIAALFPNAVIFDENRRVLHTPKQVHSQGAM